MMRYSFLIILSVLYADALWAYSPANKPDVKTNEDISINEELSKAVSEGYVTSCKENFQIQLGAFKIKSNAETLHEKAKVYLDKNARILYEDGYYKVQINRVPGIRDTVGNKSGRTYDETIVNSSDTINNYDTIQISAVAPDTLRSSTFLSDTMEATRQVATKAGKLFFMNGDSPWLRRINYFGKSFAFVNALILTIILSIATMIILLVVILFNRRRMEREGILHQYLMEKYQNLIVDYLFGNAEIQEFRSIASDNYRRQVLIDQMIDVSINLKGDEENKLLGLYKNLGLDKDSIRRAHSRRWHKKVKGFRELAFMNIKDANDAMYKALDSSNDILRMEAQIALVRLSDHDPFEFLSRLTTPFSLWEQITLHDLIIQHNIPVPSFEKWLLSPNSTVVMFALRMIREFKQTESEDKVRDTLLHHDPLVSQLAVQVAGDLNMRSTLETMKRMYKNQEYNTCLEIIRSMGKMPDISMMGFLKLVLDKEDDVKLQIEATKAIENNGEAGIKELVKLMKSEYKNYNIIIRHVLDRRIY
jgi:hypothetical protein